MILFQLSDLAMPAEVYATFLREWHALMSVTCTLWHQRPSDCRSEAELRRDKRKKDDCDPQDSDPNIEAHLVEKIPA